jgi:superfamily II DNA or RNA helicase
VGLARQLGDEVEHHIQARGRDYFRAGAVDVEHGDAWRLRASVRGAERYFVELTRTEDGLVEASCTCPYAEGGDACKHIWATILAADERQWLGGDAEAQTPARGLEVRTTARVGGTHLAGPHTPPAESEDAEEDDPDADEVDLDDANPYAPHANEVFAREWDHLVRQSRRRSPRSSRRTPLLASRPGAERAAPGRPTWRQIVARLPAASSSPLSVVAPREGQREILYILDAHLTGTAGGLVIEVAWRDRKVNGEWGVPRTRTHLGREVAGATTSADETALWLLWAVSHGSLYGTYNADLTHALSAQRNQVRIPGPLVAQVVPQLCATGRCLLRTAPTELGTAPLAWDDGPPWRLWLDVTQGANGQVTLDYSVRRGETRLSPNEIAVLTADGHLLTDTHVARFDHGGGFGWLSLLHGAGPVTVPAADTDALIAEIATRPGATPLELDPGLGITERRLPPRPRLTIRADEGVDEDRTPLLTADVRFVYDGVEMPWSTPIDRVFRTEGRTLIVRDREAERAAIADLTPAGLRAQAFAYGDEPAWTINADRLPAAVRTLSARGWTVEASGRVYRHAIGTKTWVRSGIDWFDLEGRVDFGPASASIGEVLAALARGEHTIVLSDGSAGVLPEDWLAKVGRWTALGEPSEEGVRFSSNQAALVDALVAALPEVDVDAQFAHAREALRGFDRIEPAEPPASFHGELRAYQREGLGWLRFLERFGFGGCLADDMGLGKTVQVLAALADRRAASPQPPPSLVIVPRSIVFNWLREAARFTPSLKVIDHTGVSRSRNPEELADADLIVTTYGTLRRDAAQFSTMAFDYVVLDEAHAIKNVDSQTARTVRLLRASHRLALTGTPVQNHLGELWSLFEFLNPGVLGRSAAFSRLLDKGALDETGRALVAAAVGPFILRRTKADVARDLPAKVEDTLVCRLGPDERAFYDSLRAHYRDALNRRIATSGWAQSKILVLEALLRLRQAACHPGLVDKNWKHESSAKLDVLVSHLSEVLEEGHKAIVFSQFVKLLDRVRGALDGLGVAYEYLDGRTRDRDARVDRFQNDPNCQLFLVSLKAGGVGLNLTAAEYVFLLDPWWNPAIEAQAIDRAHRIGQTRQVFAYRLIAEGTIEEKVLELQDRKRGLADAILGEDATGLKQLTREDLELLLS